MSDLLPSFDPSAKTTDTFTPNLSNGIGKIVVTNESDWALTLKLPDGSNVLAPAWTAQIYHLNGPAGKVTWTQNMQLTLSGAPISQVFVEVYKDSEAVPGVYPLALVRQTSVGNTVTTTAAKFAHAGPLSVTPTATTFAHGLGVTPTSAWVSIRPSNLAIATDTFVRANNANGWGTASDGEAWGIANGYRHNPRSSLSPVIRASGYARISQALIVVFFSGQQST
jgi:hypothetical protein